MWDIVIYLIGVSISGYMRCFGKTSAVPTDAMAACRIELVHVLSFGYLLLFIGLLFHD